LSSFIALGSTGCTVGGNQFANFTTLGVSTGATPISPNNITVNLLNGPSGPGLVFQLNLSAGPGQVFETLIAYQVTGAPLIGNTLSITGASATGDGAVTAVEDKCLNGTFGSGVSGCTGTPRTLIVFATEFDSLLSDQLTFGAVPRISVVTDIVIDGGPVGTAALSGSVTNQFRTGANQPVPEPATLLLFGSGLYALRRLCRRSGKLKQPTVGQSLAARKKEKEEFVCDI
jgi:hypothetical protein